MTVPEIAGTTRAEDIRACWEAALAGERSQLEMAGYDPPDRLWSLTFVPLDGDGPGGGMVLCRVAQQALANVVDHAQATHALVAIECGDRDVVLRVSDDGCGFAPGHVQADIAHFGLIAMRERVEALGGCFRVRTAPGQGTVVEARLPLTDPTEGPGA